MDSLSFPLLSNDYLMKIFLETLRRAEEGDCQAQYAIGSRFLIGQPIPKDSHSAIKWFTKSAEQGHTEAMHCLAAMFFNGDGIPINLVKSYAWFSVIAKLKNGDKESKNEHDFVLKKLTTDQIEDAKKLADEILGKINANKNRRILSN